MSRSLIRFKHAEIIQPDSNSLESKIRSRLAAKFGPAPAEGDFALLLDTTGSMYGEKIRKLRESVRAFPAVRKFDYNDDCIELRAGEECREPEGNNNEELAFARLKAEGIKRIVMITDGYPDRPEGALRAATGLHIDIIYIGPPPPPKFLEQLAKQCGGRFDSHVEFAKMDGAKSLEAKVRGLLPAPQEEKGAICL